MKNITIKLLGVLIGVYAMVCPGYAEANKPKANVQKVQPSTPMLVSMIQLIANPNKYHRKVVQVVGYANVNFEGNGVWFSREAFKNGLLKNAIWLDWFDNKSLAAERLDNKYVIVEGIFNMNFLGHKDLYAGALQKITRLDDWESAGVATRVEPSK